MRRRRSSTSTAMARASFPAPASSRRAVPRMATSFSSSCVSMRNGQPAARPHAIYPGSFDPPTNGHLDVIGRAAAVFSTVTVAVVVNPQKRDPQFTLDEREEMLRRCTTHWPNVRVDHFRGLLADYVRRIEADVIVKGLRVVSD